MSALWLTATDGNAAPAPVPAIARAMQIALGSAHGCAVTNQGGVRCWGWNHDGQLGDGTLTSRLVPVDVQGLGAPIAAVAAGYNHSCALTSAGGVECWGANPNGQLGRDRSNSCGACPEPLLIESLDGVTQLAAGYAHTCAVQSSGALQCWGFNRYGQLGDGSTNDRHSPTAVSGLSSGVTAVAPGDVQTCALMQDGTVKCWGNNLLGELGTGTRNASMTPGTVCADSSCTKPLGNIIQLASGDHHSCALSASGDVFCWGSNVYDQLGIPSPELCPDAGHGCSTVPVQVTGLSARVTSLSASTASTCARVDSGAVQCWGLAFESSQAVPTPTVVEGWQSGVDAVAAALYFACAVGDGAVSCYGKNEYGQLGDGSLVTRGPAQPPRVWLLSGRGDADCDADITSLDATMVLQDVAGLIGELPCPKAAMALDQTISSNDALLILQFVAGLLS